MSRSRWSLEEGWITFLLLVLMLLCVVWSVRAAEWTGGLGILQWIAIVALLATLALARSRRLPGILALLLLLVLGVAWTALLLTFIFSPPLVPFEMVPATAGIVQRIQVMSRQMWRWVSAPGGAGPWLSNFMFDALLAGLTWLLCCWSVWTILRWHWVWAAVVPAGVACLVNIYYGPPRLMIYFALYLLFALLLVVRMHVYLRQRSWRKDAISYSLDVDLAFLRDGLLVSSLAMVLAWTVPVAAQNPRLAGFWYRFQGPWNDVQERWTRLFTSLDYQGSSSLVQFGQTMTLGGAVSLSNTPVLETVSRQSHYWQAVVYDRYTGSGWLNTDSVELALKFSGPVRWQITDGQEASGPAVQISSGAGILTEPTATLNLPYESQRVLTYTVRMLQSGESFLFVPGQLLGIDLGAVARVAAQPLSGDLSALDISMLQSNTPLRLNQSYSAVALVSSATAGQLRNSGTDYPNQIRERYLALPRSVPERVRSLAREITKGSVRPYDQAEAIQNYLRRIEYDQYISAPPAGRDVVDWFLFESRRGYCDYYASAMVVLCRTLGIPARIAQGYAPGEYDGTLGRYVIRQLDAHAWPLVYFPGYGWVKFEPTSSEPAPQRPDGNPDAEGGSTVLLPGTVAPENEDKYGSDEAASDDDIVDIALNEPPSLYRRLLRPALAAGGMLLAAASALVVWWYAGLRGLSPASRVYEQMRRLAGLVGVPHQKHQTPNEFGEALGNLLLSHQEDVRFVVSKYAKQRFSRDGLTAGERKELAARWRRLRLCLWGQALRPRFRRRTRTDTWVSANSLRPAG